MGQIAPENGGQNSSKQLERKVKNKIMWIWWKNNYSFFHQYPPIFDYILQNGIYICIYKYIYLYIEVLLESISFPKSEKIDAIEKMSKPYIRYNISYSRGDVWSYVLHPSELNQFLQCGHFCLLISIWIYLSCRIKYCKVSSTEIIQGWSMADVRPCR